MKPLLPGNMFVVIILTHYVYYILNFISKKQRDSIKITNNELNKLRKIPIKTLDEQKKFINIRYPKATKFKYTPMNIVMVIVNTIIYLLLFFGINYLISERLGLKFSIGFGVTFIILFPLAINFILKKFNLNKQDISYIIRLK